MLYLIALLLPPLAVLLCGKPFQAILSLILTLFGYIPGQVHACLVVHERYADLRSREATATLARARWATAER